MARKQVNVRLDEGLVARIEAQLGGRSLQSWFEAACLHSLDCLLAKTASAASSATVASRPGWEGSKLPGHRDVPELGWYRPSSAEARKDVVLDVEMLRAGLAVGARSGARE